MTLNLLDPKIALIHGALTEVLGKNDTTKIADYFSEDAVMVINEKKLQRHEIDNRINWIKNNTKSVNVVIHNAFFNGEQGFDYHTTEVIDKNDQRSIYKVFGYIQLKDQKICLYEDVTIQIEGEEAMHAVNSTST